MSGSCGPRLDRILQIAKPMRMRRPRRGDRGRLVTGGLGEVDRWLSRFDDARRECEEALRIYTETGNAHGHGRSLRELARLASEGSERINHARAALEAWSGLGRPDLI